MHRVRNTTNVAAVAALAAGCFILALAIGACSREPASIKELKAERALADSLVKGFMPSSTDSLVKVVALAREKTRHFLLAHENDVPAALLFAKLRLAETALTPQPMPPPDSTGAPPDHFARAVLSKATLEDAIAKLDHAITVEPKNADLYYWKALLHGTWEPIFDKQVIDPKRSQLKEATAAAGKAMELAPDSSKYRMVYASYQMLGGDDKAALKTLRAGKDTTDATLRILTDWERFPLPPGAVYSLRESAGIAEWMAASGLNDASARVRAYWVPGSQEGVRAFYAQRWPGLFWLSQKQKQQNGELWAFGSAALVMEGTGYAPVREADINNQARMANAQGVSIQVREARNLTEASKAAIPFDPGDVVCEVLLTNHRRVR